MKIAYLKDGGRHGYVDLPGVTTAYERIVTSYPNRAPRYCHPEYNGGISRDSLLSVWQWEPDGHAAGRYGSGDAGLPAVETAPPEELARLSREITAALDAMHADPAAHPDAAPYFASCAEHGAILAEIERPYQEMASRSGKEEIEAASRIIGRRRTCSRREMATILATCQPVCDQSMTPEQWATACVGDTLVSVTRGVVRYDQPGSLPGGKCATLMFAPRGLAASRNWADRIVIVK